MKHKPAKSAMKMSSSHFSLNRQPGQLMKHSRGFLLLFSPGIG
jgi:hypothetical protein